MPPYAIALPLIAACVSALAAEPQNLVRNGSFEQAGKDGKTPAGWSFAWKSTHSSDKSLGYQKREPDWGLDREQARVGRQSFRIAVTRDKDDGVLSQEGVPAKPGATMYMVKAWIKTKGMKGATANVALVSQSAKNKWLGANYSIITVRDDRDWTEYAGYFHAPPKTAKMRLRLWLNFNYSGAGAAWFDDVRVYATDLKEMPPIRYVDDTPPPPIRPEERRGGFRLFTRTYLEMIFPNSVPKADEIDRPVAIAATPGEREPISFCVRALRPLKRVKVEIGDFVGPDGARIPASAVSLGLVRFLYRRGQARWGPFMDGRMLVPTYVEPGRAFNLDARETKQVWATLLVPADAKPGAYRATATVTPAGGEGRDLPIELAVRPFRLAEPKNVFFGMYSRFHKESETKQDEIYADMRAHGMTTVGHCGPLGSKISKQGGRVVVAFDGKGELERAMAAYVKAGFPEPFVWLMGRDVMRWCEKQGPLESDAFADSYRQVILRILEHGKREGWPEIIFQPLDEPFEHAKRLAAAKRCLQILKSIPGVRTEEDGPNGRPEALEEVYALCDVIVQHDGPVMRRGRYDAAAWQAFLDRTKRDGKMVWFYNIDLTGYHPEVMRWGYGFGLWFSGATGMIEWAYQFPVGRWSNDKVYERENTIIYQYPPATTEPGGPAIGWEGIREGVDDYKYIHLLHQLMAQAKAAGKAGDVVAEAEAFVAKLRAQTDFRGHEGSACQGDWTGRKEFSAAGDKTVSGSYKMANGWSFADYDAAREKIAGFIVQLQGEL